MRIKNNIPSLNTNNNLKNNTSKIAKTLQKLSSGYKINSASDDAAGLAISEKLRAQIKGLHIAGKNTQDSISLIQTAEGALGEVHEILHRVRELSIQASNDTNTYEDRSNLQDEIDELLDEINNIANTTNFNTIPLLNVTSNTGNNTVNPPPAIVIQSSINNQSQYKIVEGLNDSLSINANGNLIQINIPPATYTGASFLTELNNQLTHNNLLLTAKYSDDLTKIEMISDDTTLQISNISGNLAANVITPTSTSATVSNNYRLAGHTILSPGITITSGVNDTLSFEVDSINYSITLASGHYSIDADTSIANQNSSLLTQINNQLVSQNAPVNVGFIYSKGYGPGLDGASLYFNVDASKLNSNQTTHTIGNFDGNAKNTLFSSFQNGSTLVDASLLSSFNVTYTPTSILSAKKLLEPIQIVAGQNDVLSFELNGQPKSIQINPGTYSTSQILNELNNQFSLNNINLTASTDNQDKLKLSMNQYQSGSTISKISGNAGNFLFFDANDVSFSIANNHLIPSTAPNDTLTFQIGANSDQNVQLNLCDVRTQALNLQSANVQFQANANQCIELCDKAINTVSYHRSRLGAYQNRLEYTYNTNMNTAENLQKSESIIRDANMASEMMKFTKQNILNQTAQALLAQSNQSSQEILKLLA